MAEPLIGGKDPNFGTCLAETTIEGQRVLLYSADKARQNFTVVVPSPQFIKRDCPIFVTEISRKIAKEVGDTLGNAKFGLKEPEASWHRDLGCSILFFVDKNKESPLSSAEASVREETIRTLFTRTCEEIDQPVRKAARLMREQSANKKDTLGRERRERQKSSKPRAGGPLTSEERADYSILLALAELSSYDQETSRPIDDILVQINGMATQYKPSQDTVRNALPGLQSKGYIRRYDGDTFSMASPGYGRIKDLEARQNVRTR